MLGGFKINVMRQKNKKKNNLKLVIVASVVVLLVLLFFIQQSTSFSKRRQQIEAAVSSGQSMGVCQMLDGQIVGVPTGFYVVDAASPNGRFIVRPGLVDTRKAIGDFLNIWTGQFSVGEIFDYSEVKELNIVEAVEKILLFRVVEVNNNLKRANVELERVSNDSARGPNSFAYRALLQRKNNLKSQDRELISGLMRLYRLVGTGRPYPCYLLGVEGLPTRERQMEIIKDFNRNN